MWISQNIRFRPVYGEAFVKKGGETYAPYGFSSSPPQNLKGIAVPSESGDITVAYEMPQNSLSEGEVRLYSKSGAYIHLRNDGSVVINGLVINLGGVIEEQTGSGGSDSGGGSIFE